jgi:hypothetical protein
VPGHINLPLWVADVDKDKNEIDIHKNRENAWAVGIDWVCSSCAGVVSTLCIIATVQVVDQKTVWDTLI